MVGSEGFAVSSLKYRQIKSKRAKNRPMMSGGLLCSKNVD